MDSPNIRYVIHIAATPEVLWEALTSSESLKKNWGRIESRWTRGSTVTEVAESGKLLWKGEVLHSDPPRRLTFSFDVTGSGEPPTEVTFELSPPDTKVAPDRPVVKLTVTQTGFEQDSKLFAGCGRAWPEIMSSVKTYLETGRALAFDWKH